LSNRLGIAIAGRIYKAYLELLRNLARSARTMPAPGRNDFYGPAPAPRTQGPDTLYIKALAAHSR